MAYLALYRKYRPKKFEDVVGQDIIVKILKNSIINNKISHAYLFNGARGTGKTSIAKIFAKSVNCELTNCGEACEKCNICLSLEKNDVDIIEIDAASNNGVEEIREIRNKVKLMPSVGKYKVYIIDEVHMLSMGAFNALLKTLEEPPKHVIFILATTEIHKIPLTILSRCQRFDFNKITQTCLVDRLKYICDKEERVLSDDILQLIAKLSDGGCRDAINLLDQVLSLNTDTVTEDDVYSINGTISDKIIISLFKSLYEKDLVNGLTIIANLVDEGKNLSFVVDKMLILIRNLSINLAVKEYFDTEYKKVLDMFNVDMETLKKVSEVLIELNNQLSKSTNQKDLFEIYYIYLTEVINTDVKEAKNINTIKKDINIVNKDSNNKIDVKSNKSIDKNDDDKMSLDNEYFELQKIRVNNALATAQKSELSKILKDFDIINDFISNKLYNNIVALLLESKIVVASPSYLIFSFNDNTLISVFYSNLEKIEQFVNEIFEKKYFVTAVSDKEWNEIKLKYVNDVKNNIKYELIPEVKIKKQNKKSTKIENIAIDLFGEEVVETK